MTVQSNIPLSQMCEAYRSDLKMTQEGQTALQETYDSHFKKQLIKQLH